MAKSKNENELSFAAWVRNVVINNPSLDLEGLQAEFDKANRSETKPDNKQVIYQAATNIRKRWGVDPSELPRNKDGSLNMSGMVRLYLDKFGDDATEKKASVYFLTDGLELKPGQFGNAKSTYLRKKGNLDPNKGRGPRARFASKKSKSNGRKVSRNDGRNKIKDLGFEALMRAKKYIDSVGGFDEARALVDFIEEIQSL